MKKMTIKTIAIRAMAMLAFTLTLGACSENENEMPDTTPGGEKMTFTVNLPGADTRLAHEKNGDAGVKVSWTEDDELILFDEESMAAPIIYTVKNGSITNEGKTATFEGDEIGMGDYYVYGPVQGGKIPDDESYAFYFSFLEQVQSENDNLEHLPAYDLISAKITNGNVSNLSFSHMASIFQFNLTGLPAGTYNKFTIKSSVSDGILNSIQPAGGTSYAQEFPVGLSDIVLDGSKNLTVWAMLPVTGTDAVFKAGNLTLEVTNTGGNTYINTTAITIPSEGMLYEQGKRYTMTTAMQKVGPEILSMQFTVKPTDTQSEFILPFYATTGDYTLTVDWGDGSAITPIPAGTETNSDLLKHTYTNDGSSYQITLTTNAPSTGEQMPRWRFYTNASAPMLVSMNSPMLNAAVADISSCFRDCSNLTSIPGDLFAANMSVTNFGHCFRDCTKLASVPGTLFADHTAVTTFTYCFRECNALTAIPVTLFANNRLVTSFSYCFYNCNSLAVIPDELFINNTAVTTFGYCFYGCSSLTAIPEGLFTTNTRAKVFNYSFGYCSGLTAIPAGLFTANEAATNFSFCFLRCEGISQIPASLFVTNTLVTNFASCFESCTGITTIPVGLFTTNTRVTSFNSCFRGLERITEIPVGLFDANTRVTSFGYCFQSCIGLTAIPAGLFANNIVANDFQFCFKGCTKTVLNSNIFCDEATEKATRFAGQTVNFTHCFGSAGSILGANSAGVAPALWEYEYENGTGVTTSSSCFYDCTKITNHTAIPSGWK